jgi:hypothetical protein
VGRYFQRLGRRRGVAEAKEERTCLVFGKLLYIYRGSVYGHVVAEFLPICNNRYGKEPGCDVT